MELAFAEAMADTDPEEAEGSSWSGIDNGIAFTSVIFIELPP
jgi:hypothetical protein